MAPSNDKGNSDKDKDYDEDELELVSLEECEEYKEEFGKNDPSPQQDGSQQGVTSTNDQNASIEDDGMIFFAPGRGENGEGEYLEISAADIDALKVNVDELDKLATEIEDVRKLFIGSGNSSENLRKASELEENRLVIVLKFSFSYDQLNLLVCHKFCRSGPDSAFLRSFNSIFSFR